MARRLGAMVLPVMTAILLAAAGCSVPGSVSDDPEAVASSPAEHETAEEPAAEADESEEAPEPEAEAVAEPEDEGVAKWGETYAYVDGLEVKLSKPEKFEATEWAMVTTEDGTDLRWTVTVTNGTGKKYDPSMFSVTASSGEKEAEEIFDTDNGLDGSPMTSVRDGKSIKFDIGFRVADPKDVTLEVSPGFDYDSAIWSNS